MGAGEMGDILDKNRRSMMAVLVHVCKGSVW